MSRACPSRSTRQWCGTSVFSASRACSERYSCTKATVTTIVMAWAGWARGWGAREGVMRRRNPAPPSGAVSGQWRAPPPVRTRVIDNASSYCLMRADTNADASRRPIRGSLNCSTNLETRLSFSPTANSLRPCSARRRNTSRASSPDAGSSPTRASVSGTLSLHAVAEPTLEFMAVLGRCTTAAHPDPWVGRAVVRVPLGAAASVPRTQACLHTDQVAQVKVRRYGARLPSTPRPALDQPSTVWPRRDGCPCPGRPLPRRRYRIRRGSRHL